MPARGGLHPIFTATREHACSFWDSYWGIKSIDLYTDCLTLRISYEAAYSDQVLVYAADGG
jgi:hypothetical protein